MGVAVGNASAEGFNPDQYVAEGAVKLFWNACVKFYPEQEAFNHWIEQNDFDAVPNSMVKPFIRGPESRVYSVNNQGVRYLLVAEPSGLCTVFVKEVNHALADQAFARWQETLKDRGWVAFDQVDTHTEEDGALTTTDYAYTLSGRPVMMLVVSKTESRQGNFQLAMSASVESVVNH